jgi:alpha-galactosidase
MGRSCSSGIKRKAQLTDLKWISATSGWGNANVDKTCEGRPLMVNNQSVSGIGVHAKSAIIYDLPEGYDTFSAKGVVTRAQGSVAFGVLVDKVTIDYPDKSVIKIDFSTIGIKGKANVVDLWSHKELGVFNIAFSREIPLHGAGLYRISPVR